MKIPFIDLKAQFRHLEERIRQSIDTVLDHGQFIMGPEVLELESQLAEFAGSRNAITCSSGTDALLMALMGKEVGRGDAVFTTPFTFIATAEVISLLGATPVFVDIDPQTFNVDPAKLDDAINSVKQEGKLKARGVIAVDIFGLPADYDRIAPIAEQHGLFVLEDAAQSFGAVYNGKRAGALGDVAATSFFPAKPLGCYGDGGAILTDDDELARMLRSIRVHGAGEDKYHNVRIGLNGRLDTIQAAILLQKLSVFQEELDLRQKVALQFTDAFEQWANHLALQSIPNGSRSAWAQYSLLSEHKKELCAALNEAGVPTAVYYPIPLHQQGAFAHLGYRRGDLPVSEHIAEQIFSIPMHPYLHDADIQNIVEVFNSYFND